MKTITEKQLREEAAQKKEFNLIAFAVTPWHAMGVKAAIQKLTAQGIALSGYVFMETHPVTGLGLTEKDFILDEMKNIEIAQIEYSQTNGKFFTKLTNKMKKLFSEISYYIKPLTKKSEWKEMYWIVPLRPSYQTIPLITPFSNNIFTKVIAVDEGLGSYLTSDWEWIKVGFEEGGIKAGIKLAFELIFCNPIYQKILEKRKQYDFLGLFQKEEKKWIPNLENILIYQDVVKWGLIQLPGSKYSGSIIISADLLYTIGVFKEKADVKIYKKIGEAFQSVKKSMILKPHPRCKNLNYYNGIPCAIIDEEGGAMEQILPSLEQLPQAIIGMDTTVLVTANILFGVKTISIIDLIDSSEIIDHKRFKYFKDTFSSCVLFPKNMEELLAMILEPEQIVEKS